MKPVYHYALLKRAFDLIASLFGLFFLLPVFVLVAIFVRLRLGAPVIFKQERPGLNSKKFNLYKFRTMTDERDRDGHLLPDAARLTDFGRFLRRTSLDELPELLNVIKGEMSLVGPRPLLMRYQPYFKEDERIRFTVRPGITGWAQVNGRNLATWDKRLSLDKWYVEERNFSLDVKILLMTLSKVLSSHGVVEDPESAMLNLDEERKNIVGTSEASGEV
jgi:lipopolysaccharide/colanic/teichoic acid biosynthesis glycosyltransferase